MSVETEPRDAVPESPWPAMAYDDAHPFGDVPMGVQICAHCAALLTDSRWMIRVDQWPSGRWVHIAPGNVAALVAAAWNAKDQEFKILDPTGAPLSPLPITQVKGTLVCKLHLDSELRGLR